MKMIAIHEIVRGAGKDRETISPKSEFEVSAKERDELLAAGAAVDVEAVEEVKPKKGKKADPESEDSVI